MKEGKYIFVIRFYLIFGYEYKNNVFFYICIFSNFACVIFCDILNIRKLYFTCRILTIKRSQFKVSGFNQPCSTNRYAYIVNTIF